MLSSLISILWVVVLGYLGLMALAILVWFLVIWMMRKW